MLELIETLVKQWAVIKQAPIDFVGALVLCLAAIGTVQWHTLKIIYRKRSEKEPQTPQLKQELPSLLPPPRPALVFQQNKPPVFHVGDVEPVEVHLTRDERWEFGHDRYEAKFLGNAAADCL